MKWRSYQMINEISNEELQRQMETEKLVLLDVREVEEYNEAHIPGSVLIPLGNLESRHQELDKEANVCVICHSGGRSRIACQILENLGFLHVANVVPGMIDWTGDMN